MKEITRDRLKFPISPFCCDLMFTEEDTLLDGILGDSVERLALIYVDSFAMCSYVIYDGILDDMRFDIVQAMKIIMTEYEYIYYPSKFKDYVLKFQMTYHRFVGTIQGVLNELWFDHVG